MITIQQPITWAIAQPVEFGQGSGVFIIPPISDKLLVWLKGNSTDTTKLDSWKKPYAEDMVMVQSATIQLNGVDEYGALDTAITLSGDFEINFNLLSNSDATTQIIVNGISTVSSTLRITSGRWIQVYIGGNFYEFGSVTVADGVELMGSFSRVGDQTTVTIGENTQTVTTVTDDFVVEFVGHVSTLFNGKLYNIRFRDNTKDIHFPLSETSPTATHSFSTDGQHSIEWNGTLANMRAGRQDSYHFNVTKGWYEIEGDDTKYPYPVTGYDTFHEPGTFNDAETAFAFEEFPVGSPNGIDDEILLPFDVPADATMTYGGTCTATLDIVNNKITMTAGIIRDIEIHGTLAQQLNPDGSTMLNPDSSPAANPS